MRAILKPTLLKVILALVLLVLSSYLWRMHVIFTISDTFPWGFPLQHYMAWGPCPPGQICSEANLFSLILDAIFWYVVSGFLVSRFASPQAGPVNFFLERDNL
jgi:hypothetical protein